VRFDVSFSASVVGRDFMMDLSGGNFRTVENK